MNTESTALQVLQAEKATLQAITLFNYGPNQDVASIIQNEISFLEGMALTKPDILACEPISILMNMKYVLKNNLSLDPNAGLVYTKTRNFKKQDGNWGKVLEVQPTCEGLISIAYQCGKILDHERPSVKKNEAGKVIEVTFRYMRPSPTGPRWVDISFDESDFKRWRSKSHQENSRNKPDATQVDYSNPNYSNFNGGIDPEFARAKSIRHALKKLGTNANERIMVHIKPNIQNTISKDVDMGATAEDITPEVEPEYTTFTETTAPVQETVKVTIHEEININSNDL
jgi:hypothetical protein